MWQGYNNEGCMPGDRELLTRHGGAANQWYGREFCPHPDRPCIDGCSFCGAQLEINEHNHTLQQREPDRYECVCFNC